MNKKLYLPLIIFLIFVIVATVALIRNAQGEDPKALESALVGKKVPLTTQLIDLFDQRKSYNDQLFLQQKPLLLNVWATWCPTCFAEHQYLNQLAKQGITIIGINYKDDVEKAKKWLNDLGNPYQEVINDQKGSFGLDLGVYGAPETFIVDCQGIIRYRHAGDINQQVWQQKLQPLYEKYAKEAVCSAK
ncbi:MAG TPA: DsbE family thiol:disulfide interchange protein [Gallibacterium anatis]|uniref:DsbE family thiol:disulfide interchange protein n=1 Tax=Gallibacterium anatis TaxID=750 RepID=A0A921H7V9_9PAST|nr:DsbE family thiol:disulfide interchange protein [Gallibacterium anatis]MDK9560265.1 DsbE family thiol:disulfide interchange protein [Gallibacterium anatis]HJF72929.1 DsbE family thiol:disulfide interchange protein [Gallibacterium anatis]